MRTPPGRQSLPQKRFFQVLRFTGGGFSAPNLHRPEAGDLMQRISELVGKPIVSAATGERVGRVTDLLLDRGSCRTVGLVLAGGLMSSEHVLPYSDVQVVGKDAIVARSGDGVMGPKEWKAQGLETAR